MLNLGVGTCGIQNPAARNPSIVFFHAFAGRGGTVFKTKQFISFYVKV